jgi:hypothetical protein
MTFFFVSTILGNEVLTNSVAVLCLIVLIVTELDYLKSHVQQSAEWHESEPITFISSLHKYISQGLGSQM